MVLRGVSSTAIIRLRVAVSCRTSSRTGLSWLTCAKEAGVAISAIRSAISASSARVGLVEEEARTILTCGGKRCRKSSHTNELPGAGPELLSSCCIRRSNCVGLQLPSSSAVKSCWRQRCYEASVRLTSCSFSVVGVLEEWRTRT